MNEEPIKRAFLVAPYRSPTTADEAKELLSELASLTTTYGAEVVGEQLAHLREIDSSTFIGSGKVEMLAKEALDLGATMIVIDEKISPNQQKNLEEAFKKPVVDRAGLILEIFAKRAQTREGKLQVELARNEYMLPRLKNLWTHLSRQKSGGGMGGSAAVKGEGEKQIELDRRILKHRIHVLKKELEEVRAQRHVQRQARLKASLPTFGIVGYTNAGKSTLFNKLTGADILAENKLFATLDTTVRKFRLPNHQEILLVDTVGFVRRLPHNLVAAFRGTLEESLYTDILLHVVDISHSSAFIQAKTTHEVLEEIGAGGKPMITVLNKIDSLATREAIGRMKVTYPQTVAISCETGEGIESLLEMMMKAVAALRRSLFACIPMDRYELVTRLISQGEVKESFYESDGVFLELELDEASFRAVEPYLIEEKEYLAKTKEKEPLA